MPEYLKFRCCMCPNVYNDEQNAICPAMGNIHPEATPCRFVKQYIDSRGWKYKVMSGLGESTFKARYQKPDKHGSDGWHCVKALPWRDSFSEAQADLNTYAGSKGWEEWN